MPELDRFALAQLAEVLERVTTAYDEWRFHVVYRTIYEYVGELSSVYLDVLKDRLYADEARSVSRRSAQTVLAQVLAVLVRVLMPILSFTCEEVWGFMPASMRDAESVQLSDWPLVDVPAEEAAQLRSAYPTVLGVREAVTKALEDARNDKVIGKSQEAAVKLVAPPETVAVLEARTTASLAELFIVASVEIAAGPEIGIEVVPATGEKCPRCWNLRTLGVDAAHPDVCGRCAKVLSSIG